MADPGRFGKTYPFPEIPAIAGDYGIIRAKAGNKIPHDYKNRGAGSRGDGENCTIDSTDQHALTVERRSVMRNILIIALLTIWSTLCAQIERPKWEIGGGLRLNYMSLNGGFSAHRNSDGYESDIQYDEIGMNTYSTSLTIFLGARYKKWNLEFGGSRGSYEGGFVAKTNIVRDEWRIDAGSVVDGTVDLTMYLLSTAFRFIQ